MARKPKSILRGIKTTEKTFDERAFVDGVFNDEFILVVGSGVILDRTKFPESGGDINKYIIDEINKDRRAERTGFADYKSFTEVFRGTPLDEVDPIYRILADGYDYCLDDISPELTKLLRTRLFRTVLTTTIDDYVETLMRDIWGDELRIVNISDNQSLKDLQNALGKSRADKYTQPTLFYAFGKVISGRPKPRGYVETDVDAIKIIEKWMMEVDSKHIVPFLKEKRILALGCKFDDWYFRFFWYILTRGFSDTDREGYKDFDGHLLTCDNLATVFDPENPSDRQLKDYLQRQGVCMHEDIWEFMNHIHDLLTSTEQDSPFRNMVLEKRRQGGIFISYKSCDALTASELFCKLARENNLNVWFDNVSLNGGDEYNITISRAIGQAKIFIPVLSPEIALELEEYGKSIDTFYSKEWRMAAEKENMIIIPVAADGYDLRSDVHKIFEAVVGTQNSGIDLTYGISASGSHQKSGFAKLLESVKNHLGLE